MSHGGNRAAGAVTNVTFCREAYEKSIEPADTGCLSKSSSVGLAHDECRGLLLFFRASETAGQNIAESVSAAH